MQENNVVLVLTHTPTLDCAKHIARTLLAEGLAACINIGSPVVSVYEWESAVHESEEIPMVVKTIQRHQERLLERLVALHPYAVPEALVVPTIAGYSPYLAWVQSSTLRDPE